MAQKGNTMNQQIVKLSKPNTAIHIKETAVKVRVALVTANLVAALENLQHIITVANQLKEAIVQDATVVAQFANVNAAIEKPATKSAKAKASAA